jgi:hypothetical protein
MTRDEHQMISVTLDPTRSARAVASLSNALTVAPSIDLAKALYGQQMRATLAGQGFEITPLGAGERPVVVSSTIPTEWKWDVTPRQNGQRTLTLTLEPLVATPVGTASRPQTIMTRDVDVRVSWLGRFKDLMNWLVAHWVVVAAVAGAVVLAWRWLRRPKSRPIGFQPLSNREHR